ncbi:fatty acid desaturase 2-like [Brachionus plicatilis]|uniref:Fatty acid desaturase 2-like n=1 Tax=Brachionus plicatilis TaxID=10195 RepID=A0A3M7Q6P2_BRAPC|nr:fatty acid desaturase 2-like [Brachionus plicatilis]
MNHFVQNIIIGGIIGFSTNWWNYRHYQHHAKPNTIKRDPDIRFGLLYLIGKVVPVDLFPTMPRHNYFKIAPDVKELCKKYNIEYHCLKESGELWYEAYNIDAITQVTRSDTTE